MMNVKVNGKQITITFELQPARPSSTGKTNIVFTTGGYKPITDTDMRINLTVTTPRTK